MEIISITTNSNIIFETKLTGRNVGHAALLDSFPVCMHTRITWLVQPPLQSYRQWVLFEHKEPGLGTARLLESPSAPASVPLDRKLKAFTMYKTMQIYHPSGVAAVRELGDHLDWAGEEYYGNQPDPRSLSGRLRPYFSIHLV
jgi:hypothetical protein